MKRVKETLLWAVEQAKDARTARPQLPLLSLTSACKFLPILFFFILSALCLPELAHAQEYHGWRTDVPPIDGQTPAYVCKLMIGATDPRFVYASSYPDLEKWDIPSVPVDKADRPVFYGKGPIKVVFGEQALQWSDICAAKDSLHYKMRLESNEYTASNMIRLIDPVSRKWGPIDLRNPADAPSVIDPDMPWTFSPVYDAHFQALYVDRADGRAAILSRASTPSVSEELYPLDDRMVLNLTGLPLASGTLVVHMPGRVAETGKPYALVNGEQAEARVYQSHGTGLQGLGEGLGPHTTFEVQYAPEPAGAYVQIEIFPEVKDKHLYRAWDGRCYRHGGSSSDPGAVTIYKISTGMPACTTHSTAMALQEVGWGVIRPDDGSPIEALTTVTSFDGQYMVPRVSEEPVITQEGDITYFAVVPLQSMPPDFDLLDHDGLPTRHMEVQQNQDARFLMVTHYPKNGAISFQIRDTPSFIDGWCGGYECGVDIPSSVMPGHYHFSIELTDGMVSKSKQYSLVIVPAQNDFDYPTSYSEPTIEVTDERGRSVSEVTVQKSRGYSDNDVSFFINITGANTLRLDGAPPFIWLEDRGGGDYAMTVTTLFSTARDYSFDIVASNELGEARKEFRLNLEEFPFPIYRAGPAIIPF